jgi:hypothetical protein
MLERDEIGNKEWTKGFLCDIDVSELETFDSEMRSRKLSNASDEPSACIQPLHEDAGEVPTHCEHGIPSNEKCGRCASAYPKRLGW